MSPVLRATRGLPGSGKTTYARSLGWVRCNRDDLRRELFGRLAPLHSDPTRAREMEAQVTEVQHRRIAAALAAGLDVVVDDTNVVKDRLESLRHLAQAAGAQFEVIEFRVPVAVAIARQAGRPLAEQVPPAEIRRLAALAPDLDI